MKLAYSILLGEHVEASTVVYGDCARYQITCPNCKEPVYKVERKSSRSSEQLGYFSHYEKEKAYAEVCELRVSALTPIQIESERAVSRSQKLAYFLRVIQRAAAVEVKRELRLGADKHTVLDSRMEMALRSEGLMEYRERTFRPYAREMLKGAEEVKSKIEQALLMMKHRDEEIRDSPFTTEMQCRIALDVWRHVQTKKAQEVFSFLSTLAFLKTGSEVYGDAETQGIFHGAEGIIFVDSFTEISRAKRREAPRLIERLAAMRVKISNGEGNTMQVNSLALMNSLVGDAMLRIIIRLPYYEMLKAAQGNDADNPFLKRPLVKANGANLQTNFPHGTRALTGAEIIGGGSQRLLTVNSPISNILGRLRAATPHSD